MAVDFSSSKLGQSKAAELDERIKRLALPNLFQEVKELKKINKLSPALINKLLKTQQSIKRNEQGLFLQYPFYGNLLSILLLELDGNTSNEEVDSDASEINSDVLERFPENVTAQLNQFYISIANENLEGAEEIVEGLEHKYAFQEESCDLKLEEFSARADIAYLYHQLDPKLYYLSVDHYEYCLANAETLLAKSNNSDFLQRVKKDVHIWQYYLLVTNNRMLNSDFLCIQEDAAVKVRTKESCFNQICELGQALLQTQQIVHPVILSRTLVDLYDAHFKMKLELRDNKCCCNMCTMLSGSFMENTQFVQSRQPFDCGKNNMNLLLSAALDLTPDDGHILEKIGRLKRVTAQSEIHLEEARDMLARCVQLYPTRHVAWHQLGKTFRSLWLFPEQKEFYCNPFRRGHQKKKKQKQKSDKDDLFSFMAAEVLKSASQSKTTAEETATSVQEDNRESSQHTVVIHAASKPRPTAQTDGKTILPERTLLKSNNPISNGLPKHQRKIDWFDHFRTENPLVSTKDTPEYLTKALDCFKRANEVVNGTHCQLWVDMSRLYISMQNYKQAERYFSKAKKCTGATLHDKAYLYEQWGLFNHVNLNQLEKAKTLYRHAVEYSVQSFQKSKIAFYNLKDILKEQLKIIEVDTGNGQADQTEDAEDSRAKEKLSLQKEYALLQKLVANFQEAKLMLCEIMSREKWRGQKELRNLAWDLVDVFASTQCYDDAWCYINSNLIYTAEKKHHRLLLDVCFGLAMQCNILEEEICANSDQGSSPKSDVLSTVFEFLSQPALKRTASEGTARKKDASRMSPQPVTRSQSQYSIRPMLAFDVLLVSDDECEEPPGYTLVRKTLLQCGLSVKGEEDILPGTITLLRYSQMMQYAKMIIIFTDDIMTAEKSKLHYIGLSILNEIATEGLNKHVVCVYSGTKQMCDLYQYANVTVIEITDLFGDHKTKKSCSHEYAFVRKIFEIISLQ